MRSLCWLSLFPVFFPPIFLFSLHDATTRRGSHQITQASPHRFLSRHDWEPNFRITVDVRSTTSNSVSASLHLEVFGAVY